MQTWTKFCLSICLFTLIFFVPQARNQIKAQDNGQVIILGEYGGLTDMAWSPDGKILAASTYTGTVLFDQNLNEIQTLENPSTVPIVNNLLWNSTGTELLAGNQTYLLDTPEKTLANNIVINWDIPTGKIVHELDLVENVFAIPQVWDDTANKVLLTATQVGETQPYQLIIWDIYNDATQEIDITELNIPGDAKWTWDADEPKLEVSRSNERISLSGPNFQTVDYTPLEQTGLLSTSPNGQYQAISSEGIVTIQSANTDLFELQDNDDSRFTRYTDVNWSADSQKLVVWGNKILPSLLVVDIQTGQTLLEYTPEREGFIASAKLSPDNSALAIRTLRHEILVYNFATETWSQKWLYGFSQSRSFSPDGTRIATARYSQDIYIWDAMTGTELEVWKSPNPPSMDNPIMSLAWSPDGQYIATGSWHHMVDPHPDQVYPFDIFIWSTETHEVIQVAPVQESYSDIVNHLEWSADSRILTYGTYSIYSGQSHIGAYNVQTEELLFEYRTLVMRDIALHPTGTLVAFPHGDINTQQSSISIIDVATGNIVGENPIDNYYNQSLDWHPSGQYLVGRGTDLTSVQIWALQDDNRLQDYMSFELENVVNFTFLRWNPQGTQLAAWYTSPEDRRETGLQIWTIDIEKKTATLSHILESEVPNYLLGTLFFSDITWSPDGNFIATSTSALTTSIWQIPIE